MRLYRLVLPLFLMGCSFGTTTKVSVIKCPPISPQVEACQALPPIADKRIPLEVIRDELYVREEYRKCKELLEVWEKAWINCGD